MEVKIQTLTPLWTGGVDGSMDRIHETGIIGSMRWWYEAIVRGLGGSACDPSTHKCPDREARYCDACALFGMTGHKRIFRIDLPALQNEDKDKQLIIKVNNNRGWYLKRGFYGELEGRFLPTRRINWAEWDEMSQFLALVLRLASEWGGLGARTQQGYGVLTTITKPELDINKALHFLEKLKHHPNRKSSINQELPSLDGFFFVKVRISSKDPCDLVKNNGTEVSDKEFAWYQEKGIIPISSLIRYYLRRLIRLQIKYNSNGANSAARWRMMGVLSARYHRGDFGKVRDIEWRCQNCGSSWNHRPKWREHPRCNGKAQQSRWQCENCKTIWSTSSQIRNETDTVERYKSLINVSNAYCVGEDLYEFRIWGWIPLGLPGNISQKFALMKLIGWLGVKNQDSRKWQDASSGNLWGRDGMNLSQPQIVWYARKNGEPTEDFLIALLAPGGAV